MLSIVQRILGVLALVTALWFLRLSEHLAVYTPSTSIHPAPLDRIDPALEGELVAVRGAVEGVVPISDGEFLVPGRYLAGVSHGTSLWSGGAWPPLSRGRRRCGS